MGEFCVIVGASGAGKTTILNILGGMDRAITFGFAILVNLIMRVKLDKINMAESLKTIE